MQYSYSCSHKASNARVFVRYSLAVGGVISKYSEIWLPPLRQVTTLVSQIATCHIASIRTLSSFICFLKSIYAQCLTTLAYPHSTQVRMELLLSLRACLSGANS
jgi:hypothetical protein